MNAIATHQLTRRFGRHDAVHDLTFELPTGSVCALVGPNGSGKTTTLKLLMNLLHPSRGRAQVLGVDSTRLGPREFARIGYVSENQQLPLWMTVRELIAYCRPLYPTWDTALERKLLDQFSLPPDRKLRHLSRGMTMKAALLVSLAYRPSLVLLDEPFSGLDPLVRDEFVHGLLEIANTGDWTVLVSSHDIDEVERLVDRLAFIDAGRLLLHESTESLQARFRRIEVNLHGAPAQLSAPSPAWLAFESSGERIRFIDTAYDPAATEAACRARFPAAAVTAHPMSLREIFVTLARAQRPASKGAAA
jgi:ABC-type multidrug transport system, ATPase component